MKNIVVGLIPGRHDFPVSEYIFPENIDPADMDRITAIADIWIEDHCKPIQRLGVGLNQYDWTTDIIVWGSDAKLTVYVTGLTAATAAVVRACALNGVSLTLMHYDRDTGGYIPQIMW